MPNKNEETKNIYQRISSVMEEVKYVQKSNAAKGIPYKSVKHDDVMGALHLPLVKHGIVVVPSIVEMTQDGNRTTAKIEVSFVNIDDPEDRFTVTYFGYGVDTQDKGPGKAFSYAVKYALLKTFCLETGDDPEKDNIEYEESNVITFEQAGALETLINGHENIRERMVNKFGQIEKIEAKQYQNIVASVHKLIAEKKEAKQ